MSVEEPESEPEEGYRDEPPPVPVQDPEVEDEAG